jgi:hypothetical protein
LSIQSCIIQAALKDQWLLLSFLGLVSNLEVVAYFKSSPIDGSSIDPVYGGPVPGAAVLPNTGGGISLDMRIFGLGSMDVCSESECMPYIGMPDGVRIDGTGWESCGIYGFCCCWKLPKDWFTG